MRLDYYHTGDASQEVFSVDRVVIEPLPWPGIRRRRSIRRISASTCLKFGTQRQNSFYIRAGSRRPSPSVSMLIW